MVYQKLNAIQLLQLSGHGEAEKKVQGERFGSLTEEEINKAIDEVIPASTKRQTRWGVGIFNGKFCFELRWFVVVWMNVIIKYNLNFFI